MTLMINGPLDGVPRAHTLPRQILRLLEQVADAARAPYGFYVQVVSYSPDISEFNYPIGTTLLDDALRLPPIGHQPDDEFAATYAAFCAVLSNRRLLKMGNPRKGTFNGITESRHIFVDDDDFRKVRTVDWFSESDGHSTHFRSSVMGEFHGEARSRTCRFTLTTGSGIDLSKSSAVVRGMLRDGLLPNYPELAQLS